VTRSKTTTLSSAQHATPAATAAGSSNAKSFYPPCSQVAWKPTLRPPKSFAAVSPPKSFVHKALPALQQSAPGVESKATSVMAPGETEPSSNGLGIECSRDHDNQQCNQLTTGPIRPGIDDGTDSENQARPPDLPCAPTGHGSGLEVDGIDEGNCIEALLSWLNNDGDEVSVYSPMTHASRTALVSVVTEAVNITRCSTSELPGMRTDWGDRACRVEAVAAWSVEDRALSWKFENWRMELQKSQHGEENLLICSALVPPSETSVYSSFSWRRHLAEGDGAVDKKYLLVCRFSAKHQSIADNKGECYAISCPPNVLPLRFASVVPTSGQQSCWSLDHRPVLPLAN